MSKVIAPFLFIAVSVGLFFSYIDPAYKSVQALVDLRNDLDTALNNSKELRAKREERLREYSSFSDTDIARLQKMLPDSVDNVRVIIELDNIASRHGVVMRNFVFTQRANAASGQAQTEEEPVTPYGTATLSFSTAAEFQDVLEFLHEAETNLRLTDVQRINITPSVAQAKGGDNGNATGGKESAGSLQFDISLQTYWLR